MRAFVSLRHYALSQNGTNEQIAELRKLLILYIEKNDKRVLVVLPKKRQPIVCHIVLLLCSVRRGGFVVGYSCWVITFRCFTVSLWGYSPNIPRFLRRLHLE